MCVLEKDNSFTIVSVKLAEQRVYIYIYRCVCVLEKYTSSTVASVVKRLNNEYIYIYIYIYVCVSFRKILNLLLFQSTQLHKEYQILLEYPERVFYGAMRSRVNLYCKSSFFMCAIMHFT